MAVTFADDFNRADQSLETSANWTRVGGTAAALEVNSNRLRCTTSGADTAYKAPSTGTVDHYAQMKLLDVGSYGGGASFLACRITDDNNFLGVRWTGSTWSVFKRVAGAFTSIGSFATPVPVVNDIVRLQCSGTNFELFRNGVSVGTGAIGAPTLTSTQAGVIARSAIQDPYLEDFETGTLTTAKSGTGTSTVASSLGKSGHKIGRGSKALSVASSLARLGRKFARGTAITTIATSLAKSGRKLSRGAGIIALHSSTARLGHKGAHGFASMHSILTMTGGSVIDVPYSGFDVNLDGTLPGDVNLTGRIYDGS